MFKKKKHDKVYEEDDGRVIADMNVEGMPCYQKDRKEKRPEKEPLELTKEEKKAVTLGMMKAMYLVVGIFIGVYFLFLLFCVFVWLK